MAGDDSVKINHTTEIFCLLMIIKTSRIIYRDEKFNY